MRDKKMGRTESARSRKAGGDCFLPSEDRVSVGEDWLSIAELIGIESKEYKSFRFVVEREEKRKAYEMAANGEANAEEPPGQRWDKYKEIT